MVSGCVQEALKPRDLRAGQDIGCHNPGSKSEPRGGRGPPMVRGGRGPLWSGEEESPLGSGMYGAEENVEGRS